MVNEKEEMCMLCIIVHKLDNRNDKKEQKKNEYDKNN